MNNFTYGYGFTDDSYFTGKYVSDYNEVINNEGRLYVFSR